MSDTKLWYAGVDWGSASHCVFLTDALGHKVGQKTFRHSGEGLAELAAWLLKESAADEPGQVFIAIEVPHGPVVETLIERGFAVHAINPKQMDRFRDRLSMSGAKDDRRDAEVMASALRTDPKAFRKLSPADPILVELREWSRIGEELGVERNRLANRLREQLWRYFPALLELEPDCAAEWLLDFLDLAATPAKARKLRETKIAELLKQKRIRRFDAATLAKTVRAPAPQLAAGSVAAASAHVASIVPRLRLVNRQIRESERRIGELTDTLMISTETEPGQKKQHDAAILASLPGVGRTVLATLLAEAWEPLQRRDYAALRSLTGVAPVTMQSGKSRYVVRRQARDNRLANALYHWARVAVQTDPRSRAKYAALRSRGHTHGRALRSVADRNLNVACAMLRADTLFDPSIAEKNVRKTT